MKLHLPLILRSMLLAVLSSFSAAHAFVVDGRTTLGSSYLDPEYWDVTINVERTGVLTTGSFFRACGTSNIYVSGTFNHGGSGIIGSVEGGSRASANISVRKGGVFHSEGYIGFMWGDSGEMTTTITVEGGTFENLRPIGYSYVAIRSGKWTTSITVENGGTFDSSSYIGYIWGDFHELTATIKVEDGSFENSSYISYICGNSGEVTTNITVGNGGTFENNGYIGYIWGDSGEGTTTITVENGTFKNSNIIGYIWGDSGEGTTTITVENGTFENRGTIGNIIGDSEGTTTVIVKGGTFENSGSIGNMSGNSGKMTTSITVENGGTFENSGYIGSVSGDSGEVTMAITVGAGADFVMSGNSSIGQVSGETNKATTNIQVEKDGCFTISSGTIGSASSGGTDITSITVKEGGTFEMQGGTINRVTGYLNEGRAYITVEKDATFNMSGGYIGFERDGDSANTVETTITIEDGGTFNMSGGIIAYGMDSSVEIIVKGKGEFNCTGGAVTSNGAKVRFTTQGGGELDMGGSSIASDVTMTGGNLRGAEMYAGRLSLVTDASYTGPMNLGGVNAARIVKLQTGRGVTVGGMTGTLTVHEGDFMHVGAGSIVGSGRAAATPMISFESASGNIVFGDSLTLYFDKGAFNGVMKSSDGKTYFEIYFTDGTLSPNDINNFVFGDEGDWKITGIKDGWLTVNATLGDEYFTEDGGSTDDEQEGEGNPGGNANVGGGEGNIGQGGSQGGNSGNHGGIGGGQGGIGDHGSHKPELGFFEQAAVDSDSSDAAQAAGGMLDSVNLLTADATLKQLGDALDTMLTRGEDTKAAKVMAAVAGGAVTALGSAQRDALRERMGRAREHAAQHYFAPQDKKLHTWIEAAASYTKVGADGDESGYKLDSWGGSVGVDYATSKEFSVGLSLTAMYGDLTAEAAEAATGKLDAYYVSGWAHKQSERWGHSFIVTFSTSDASLDRTVDYSTGAYTAQGSTSGSGYGAMYELTYDVPLSEMTFWQPLASISVMSTTMNAYNETGAEGAGLAVGEQKQTVATVAIGARWVSKAGSDLFGRTAGVELSARVAQDIGDARSEADNALLANPGYTRKVQGAEVGSTAVQIGAGLAIPTGKMSQIYVNGNTDLRSGATSWNVSAGVRLSF